MIPNRRSASRLCGVMALLFPLVLLLLPASLPAADPAPAAAKGAGGGPPATQAPEEKLRRVLARWDKGLVFATLAGLSELAEVYPGDQRVRDSLPLVVDTAELLAFKEGIAARPALRADQLPAASAKLYARLLEQVNAKAEPKAMRRELDGLLSAHPDCYAGWLLAARLALVSGDETLGRKAARSLLELGVQRNGRTFALQVMAVLEGLGWLPWRLDWAVSQDRELSGQAVELYLAAQAPNLAAQQKVALLKSFLQMSRDLADRYPDHYDLLLLRGAASLQLPDEASGRAVALRLAGLGISQRKDPGSRALYAKLLQRGWLAPAASVPVAGDFVNSIGLKMVEIAPGEFPMGSPQSEPGRRGDETRHPVRLTKRYHISDNEVSVGQWLKVMGKLPAAMPPALSDEVPVHSVSWHEAVEFCRRLSQLEKRNYRLPTEAEWEYAARGGSVSAFAFGTTLPPAKAVFGKPWSAPAPPLSGEANAFGLKNVHGGVWEWCGDWYAPYRNTDQPQNDPKGPLLGTERVLRGGSWTSSEADCRSARRHHLLPESRAGAGLRVVLKNP